MYDEKEQKEFENTIDEEMQKSYHHIIRHMITNGNAIRNQRANWFLVIQGFFLTSSMCHPEFIREQRCDTLIPFHKHSR